MWKAVDCRIPTMLYDVESQDGCESFNSLSLTVQTQDVAYHSFKERTLGKVCKAGEH